jgi:hypothetical protein
MALELPGYDGPDVVVVVVVVALHGHRLEEDDFQFPITDVKTTGLTG